MIFSRDGSGWMSVLRGGRFDVSLMSVIYSAVFPSGEKRCVGMKT